MAYNNKNLKKEIASLQSNGKNYGVIKNCYQPTPTIDHLKEIVSKSSTKPNAQINDPNIHQMIKYFLEECVNVYPNAGHKLYIISNPHSRNSAPESSGTKLHKDPMPIIHWQCRGATIWKIGNHAVSNGRIQNEAGGYVWDSEWTQEPDCFILEPGDVIWFESGVWHETENLTEKYSVVFEVESGK